MNRNIKDDISELSILLKSIKNSEEIYKFLHEILTESELDTLSKRWRIINMLKEGFTQREISSKLNVSLCKVTRGSKILKDNTSITKKYLIKEN